MSAKKITGLGGGSLYFRRALADLVMREDLAGTEIVLYDIDGEKVERMAALGRRLAEEAGKGFEVRSTTDLADAVDGADFAVSSIGGSGAEVTRNVYGSYYHAADMYIPAKYGIHQIIGDTCGPAGMMMGLRAVPVYIEICREMEKRCPDAVLFNHSNPMAVLCRAMNKYTDIKVVGVCHGVQATIEHTAKILELPADELDCTWIGTNHYYWVLSAAHKGRDVYPELMRRISERRDEKNSLLCNHLSRVYGYKTGYPGDSHLIEFYSYLAHAPSQKDLPYGLMEDALRHDFDESKPMPRKEEPSAELRAEFLKNYQELLDQVELPEEGHASREGLAAMISAIAEGRREVYIVNLPNNGAIPNLPETALVEIEGVTDSTGVRGVCVCECPPVLKGIFEKRFVWQELVVDAAIKGDKGLALQALLVDEMAVLPEQAKEMLEELLAASKDLLPQFKA